MERSKKTIVLKIKKTEEATRLEEILKEKHELEINIQQHIDANMSIMSILEKENDGDGDGDGNDEILQNQIIGIYNKLILQEIVKRKLWNKLRPYQKEYIDEAIKKLLDNVTNYKKCIIKSPTGSGKTFIIYWIIAKLYKALGYPKQFNIILATPFIKLCSQSITDEDNINILKAHNIDANYLQYDYNHKKITEMELCKSRKQDKYINFISVCNPSMLNLINFLDDKKIKINIGIYDEFHNIQSWENPKNERHKCLTSPNIDSMLFVSATPEKSQEKKTDIYGEVINKTTVKQLIELKYLCKIIPLMEIDSVNPSDPDDIILKEAFGKYYKLPYMIKESFTKYNKKKAVLFCNNIANCWRIYDLLKTRNDVMGNIKIFHPYVSRRVKKKCTVKSDSTKSNSTENDDSNSESESESESEIGDITEEETILDPEEKKNIEDVLKEYENCLEPCILITCKKIAVGYNHPPIDFIIIADNKSSITDISQIFGRGSRTYVFEDSEEKVCHVLLLIRVKDINNNNYKSIKSYLEYLQNDVGLNIESYIREQIKNQRSKVYSKYIELNHKFDLTIEYDKLKFLNKTWLQVYENISNLSSRKNVKQLEYDILHDLVKDMNFSHKDDYKSWANINSENISPELYFKNNGWVNYYKFLNINIDEYPETIEELKEICISNNIKSRIDYDSRMIELNIPSMPDELYGKYLSFNNAEISIDEIVNYLTEKELFNKVLENSKIKKCKINNEDINIFNYRPILINIYDKMDKETIFKNTKLNCKEEEINNKGFVYYEKFKLSIQGASAEKTLSEIVNMIKVNKWNMQIQIQLKHNDEIINFKI